MFTIGWTWHIGRTVPLSRLRAEARDYVLQRRQELRHEYADQQAIDDHIQLMNPKWDIGPGQLAVNEQLRAEAIAAGERPVRRFPTDVMVWANHSCPMKRCLLRRLA